MCVCVCVCEGGGVGGGLGIILHDFAQRKACMLHGHVLVIP